jgi:hypothetical protein
MRVHASVTPGSVAPSDRRVRHGLLLGAIVAAFAVQGVASPGRWQQLLVSLLLAITLLLALLAPKEKKKPRLMRPVLVIATAAVALAVVESATGNVNGAPARIVNLLLVTLAAPAIVLGVVCSLRARNQVTVEAVFGVLCLYLLLGMFFAFVYGAIDRLGDASFFTHGVQATGARCLYFSFTTLTTVGYGDLAAAGNLGHTLSVTEALMGQIYLVTIVAVIVGNLSRSRS